MSQQNSPNNNVQNELIKYNDLWSVIYSYFEDLPEDKKKNLPYKKNYYFTNHHLDSYNDFILSKIPQTLKENNPQTLFLERDDDKDNKYGEGNSYKYEIDLYYGGRDGTKVFMGKPVISYLDKRKQMFPNEARLKNLTYASNVFCNVEMVIRNNSLPPDERELESEKSKKIFEKIYLCAVPIMLHSKICVLHNQTFDTLRNMGECPFEQGGYFVVDGMEKVVVSHERKAENKIYVQSSNDEQISYTVNIKSVPQGKFKYPKTTEVSVKRKTNEFKVRLPGLRERIPLFMIFRALGFESDKEILELILGDLNDEVNKEIIDELIPSIYDGNKLYDAISCIKYMSQFTRGNSISEVINTLNTELLPHIGNSYISKGFFLGHMVKKLIYNKKNLIENTDRDSFVYKRVDLSGFLLAGLFRDTFLQWRRRAKIEIDSEYRFNNSAYINDIDNIINDSNIKQIFKSPKYDFEGEFLRAFKIGTIINKSGLIQSLSRRNFSDIISHTRRINTPNGKDTKILMGQRKLHSTQFGIICPIESPDGGNVGIKKHMTVMTRITFGCDTKPIEKCVRQLGIIYLDELLPYECVDGKVFLNGNMLGIHKDIGRLIYIMKLLRRNNLINIFTSLNWDRRFNELYISTDGGRCCRPLPVVKDNKLLLNNDIISKLKVNLYNWENLISGFDNKKSRLDYYNCDYDCRENINNLISSLEKTQGVLEYIDTDELTNCLIASSQENLGKFSNKNYTHCELHPSMMFGHLGFITPFSNNNQYPRNVFSAGQGKQGVGVYCSNFRNRMDGGVHVLNYPQKPLCNTRMTKYIMNGDLPCGNNIVVAIGSFSGYNQEDSVIINKNSIDKGMFLTTYYKVYEATEFRDKKKTSTTFYSPFEDNEITPKKEYNYSKIDEYGVVKENVYVKQKDVLVSQFSENAEGISDTSLAVKKDGGGLVDKVYVFPTNSDNHRMAKIRLCKTRIPETGDKFGSRHGQKGTIGIVMEGENMPYTKEGIVPDMIVNPHAFPSRMTIGQFLEVLGSKVSVDLGFIFDGTAFQDQNLDELGEILEKKCGYDRTGNEVLYSGRTGEQLKSDFFIGPTFYLRLKQMVQDKINSRARGPMTMRERQPPSGRAAEGGLRIGEMERDAIISHGLSQFLKESVMERSDGQENYLNISNHTGEIAAFNEKRNIYLSPSCDGPIEFEKNKYGDFELINKCNKSFSFSRVNIPYTMKILIQECEAMGIQLRLNTGERIENKFKEVEEQTPSEEDNLKLVVNDNKEKN